MQAQPEPIEPEVAFVLAAYELPRGPGCVHPLGSAGGFSGSRFWRIEQAGSSLCLQQWPEDPPPKERIEFIHSVLHHVQRQGFSLIPTVFATRSGADYVEHAGQVWELRTWLPGEADFCREPSVAKLSAAMSALAGFHRAAATFPGRGPRRGTSPGIVQRRGQLQHWLAGDAARLAAAIDPQRWPELAARGQRVLRLFDAHAIAAAAQLEHAARLEVPLQVCIRDIWHDHVLFSGDRVHGIIDFGGLGWDNVAMDVARLLGSLTVDYGAYWRQGLASYNEAHALGESELRLASIFDRSTVLMAGLNWLDWIFRQGRIFDNNQAILTRMDHILARLENL
jgi:Ser/Thr protein kinase RdoA (MazF antagonist)